VPTQLRHAVADPDRQSVAQPKPGLWQLAQDCAEVTEMRASKYSFLPSAAFSGV
jgi:hypothetical protein